jgi:exopolysaccharide biosynthesis protein
MLWIFTSSPAVCDSPPWTTLAEDLEVREVSYPSGSLFPARLIFLRSALKRFNVGVVRAADFGMTRSTVKDLVNRSKAVAGINANFFVDSGQPLGLVISRAILHGKLHRGGKALTGIFQSGRLGMSVVGREEFSPTSVVEAVQAGPRLLIKGKKVPGVHTASYSRRAGVCIDREGRLNLFCVSSGLLGLTVGQLQELLARDDVGCVDALNLDGGGSAQLYVSKTLPREELEEEILVQGSDPVPVILALFPHE